MLLDVHHLPAVNATLNALAALLLLTGFALIRSRHPVAHRNVMVAALVCSTLFLTSYLIYHAQVGSVHFPGTGSARTVYYTILISHTLLAATVPVLAGITVTRAFRRRFQRHKQLARWTLPIWLYVSVTGVVVYWMLYQMRW
jgi:putative membrane protein